MRFKPDIYSRLLFSLEEVESYQQCSHNFPRLSQIQRGDDTDFVVGCRAHYLDGVGRLVI